MSTRICPSFVSFFNVYYNCRSHSLVWLFGNHNSFVDESLLNVIKTKSPIDKTLVPQYHNN